MNNDYVENRGVTILLILVCLQTASYTKFPCGMLYRHPFTADQGIQTSDWEQFWCGGCE